MAFHETVLIGGGLSCLTVARELPGDWILFEREERLGGLCRSDELDGFVFDRTGHLLHLRDAGIQKLVQKLLPGKLGTCLRDSWVFSHERYTRYPFQSHFFGLPPEVATDCLLGVFEAQRRSGGLRVRPRRFSDWVLAAFGEGVARHFMFPYNQKLWTVPPAELTTDWLGRFVPIPDLREVVLGALSDRAAGEGYNATFLYPKRHGIESLVRALARGLKKTVCGVAIRRIDLGARRLQLSDGSSVGFGRLVSCAPLPELVRMTAPLPESIREAAAALRCASVYNLNLGIRDCGEVKHWVYVPEDRFALYRFGYASNFSARMAPRGFANVYAEVAYSRSRPIDRRSIRNRVIADLATIGVIGSKRDVALVHEFDLPYGYAIFDRHRTAAVNRIRKFFEKREIFPIGRYGRWEYSSMEDAMLQGLSLARRLAGTHLQ